MTREIHLMRKRLAEPMVTVAMACTLFDCREKSKSLIKRGLKKLKGKFQVGILPAVTSCMVCQCIPPLQTDRTWHFQHDDGLLQPGAVPPPISSSPHHSTLSPSFLHNDGSCSSSQSISSEHTDSREDLDLEGHSFIPRGATLDHNSPVTLRQKRQLKTQSMFLPTKDIASPQYGPDQTEDIVSLLDFLDETNKRPNRVSRGGECMLVLLVLVVRRVCWY